MVHDGALVIPQGGNSEIAEEGVKILAMEIINQLKFSNQDEKLPLSIVLPSGIMILMNV
jgi:hypothetical protein